MGWSIGHTGSMETQEVVGQDRREVIAGEVCKYRELCKEGEEAAQAKAALVVEIPFAQLAPKPEVPRCTQRYADGRVCDSPAVKGRDECSRHLRWNAIYPTALPFPEDALALQEMMGYVAVCVIDKLITADEARAIAELCRIMEKNLDRCRRALEGTVRRP